MPDATCVECSQPLPVRQPGTRGRAKRYCSKSCANRADYRRNRQTRQRTRKPSPTPVITKTCAWCDKTYTTSRIPGRYCSNSCASYGNGQARTSSPLRWRCCNHCSRWYPHGQCPQRDTHPVKQPPDMSPRPCHSCGKAFTPLRPAGYLAAYCSAPCRTREAKARRRAHEGTDDRYRGDRAIGRVRRHAIYQRDHWTCQLCGRKVNPKLTVPHPKAATLDHVLPVSLEGAHEEANLQLAHFECNTKKGNRVHGEGEQLRLAV